MTGLLSIGFDQTDVAVTFQLFAVQHKNLNAFIGACVKTSNVCCAWAFCAKASLKDAIANENIHLDNMFKFSIATDIAKVCHRHVLAT